MNEQLPLLPMMTTEVEDPIALRLAALASAPAPVPAPTAPSTRIASIAATESPAAGFATDWPETPPYVTEPPATASLTRATWTVSRAELEWRLPDAPVATPTTIPTIVEVDASAVPAPMSAPLVASASTTKAPRTSPTATVRRDTRGRLVVRLIAAVIVVVATLGAPAPNDPVKQQALSLVSIDAPLAPASFAVPPLEAYNAEFATESAFPSVSAGGEVEWVVALRNTGSAGWYRGVYGAQASLKALDGTLAAIQTTPYVGPGQLGWFVTRFKAPATPSTHTVRLVPSIDGRGLLPDLGIYTVVTVTR